MPDDSRTPIRNMADSLDSGVASDSVGPALGTTVPAASQRSFLSRLSKSSANPAIEPVLQSLKAHHPRASMHVVERAYDVAAAQHAGQRRKSGDPFITHPVAVALILADVGMHPDVVAAALLHDTVEDTDYTLDQLRSEFGDEIAVMVDGVTKLDKLQYGDAAQAETVRKMVVSMARDERVLVIKLADRLHNARTWRYVPVESAKRKARETLEIYAPLAHRMGINTIKWELEDRSFQVLHPKMYDEIKAMVDERQTERDTHSRVVRQEVEQLLHSQGISAVVTGRPKHLYSIYQKTMVKGRPLHDIYDLVGVRVLVNSKRDCYAVMGALHEKWKPLQGRFKDYISTPKFNRYQSLHTTVVGPGGYPVEIQIRTHSMHVQAEFGVAAHFRYKERRQTQDMPWLRRLVDWQRDATDSNEFLTSFREEMNANEIFVFTPKGDLIVLPTGATPIDFAYAVHTQVGHRTVGARVNDQLMSLDTELNTGDRVEIVTSKQEDAAPNPDWLKIVKSARARSKINQVLTRGRRDESIERGERELAKAARKHRLPVERMLTPEVLQALASELKYPDVAALHIAIGTGKLSAMHIVKRVLSDRSGLDAATEDLAEAITPRSLPKRRTVDAAVVVKGSTDVFTKLARCCTPVPGDPIMGFITKGNGVSVHRTDCTNADDLKSRPERVAEVTWSTSSGTSFLVQLHVEALNRTKLLSDVTKVFGDNGIDIHTASMQTGANQVAICRFTVELGDPRHLEHVMDQLRRVRQVYLVDRVVGGQVPGSNG